MPCVHVHKVQSIFLILVMYRAYDVSTSVVDHQRYIKRRHVIKSLLVILVVIHLTKVCDYDSCLDLFS